jgi:hypothetical protein
VYPHFPRCEWSNGRLIGYKVEAGQNNKQQEQQKKPAFFQNTTLFPYPFITAAAWSAYP